METSSICSVNTKTSSAPRVQLEPLTKESFAEFGHVVERGHVTGSLVNQGRGNKQIITEDFENLRPSAKACLSIFHISPSSLPIEVELLEKHPHSSQAFIPMCTEFPDSDEESEYLVVVANSLDTSILGTLRAFRAKATQGIIYHPDVWHFPLAVLGKAQSFSCMVCDDEMDREGDCIIEYVSQKVIVH
jgi:ureidoglycolate hydrolase